MTQLTCSKCGTANNTSDMGYCWKCKASLAPAPCSAAGLKACWEADISTAMDVVIRLSDNDRYQSDQFIREVIRKLKPWGEPPND